MRCAVYVRVSTDKEEQKSSLDNQQALFYNYLLEKGWELHEFYVDVESGTTDKRDNFQRLLADARQQKFDCILAKELSRLARNGGLAYQIKDLLRATKTQFITLDGAINTLEDNTDKFGLYAWLYEEESQRISKRIRIVLEQKAKKGEFKGSNPPYGYRTVNKRLVIRQDNTPEAIKSIFGLYMQGKGIEAIAKEMDKRGHPTPAVVAGKRNSGHYWQGSTIKLILVNRHYVGDMAQGRSKVRSVTDKVREMIAESDWIIIPNTHEPIISREDFDAVQRLLRSRYVKRPKVKKHLFTNYIYCAECGTSLWYLNNRHAYVCGRYKKHGVFACSSHSVKEDVLKKIILDDLRDMANLVVNKQEVLKRLEVKMLKAEQGKQKRLHQLETNAEKLKLENKNLIKLLAQEVISKMDYRDATEDNRKQILQLQQQIMSENEARRQHTQQVDMVQRITDELERIVDFNDLNEELLHRLVEKIEVKANLEIEIQYTFTNPFAE